MQCPRCESDLERTVSYCPECGLDIESLREKMRREQSEGDGADSGKQSGAGAAGGESASSASAGASSPATGSDPKQGSTNPETDSASAAGASEPSSGSSGTQTRESDPFERASKQSGGQSGSTTASPQQTANGGQSAGGGANVSGQRPNRQSSGTKPSQRSAETDFSLPLVQGAVYGAVTYVLNFAVVFGLFAYEMSERSADLTTSQVELHQLAGWVFYGGHRVKLESPFDAEAFNYLERVYTNVASTTVPKLAFYAVPVVGLLLAGRALASKVAGPQAADEDRVKAGATVAVGYAALAIVGAATVFSVDVSTLSFGVAQTGGAIKPKLQSAVIFMGVAYPVIAGGIGGYFAD